MQKKLSSKYKMYLAVVLTAIIIFTAWILSLQNSFKNTNTNKIQDKSWQNISENFDNLFVNVKDLKNKINDFTQSATTTGQNLQGGPEISPEQLGEMVEQLTTDDQRLTTSTATTTNL